jgi:diguanylate cyclase (GGDEF)-like protein/PAS domain S-box-containing protein
LSIQEAAESVKQQQFAFPSAGRLWFISLAVCLIALIGVGVAQFLVPQGTWSSLLTACAGTALVLIALYLLFGLSRVMAARRGAGTLLTEAADSVFRHSPFSMAVLDETGRFREVNDGTVHMLGYEKNELLGQLFLPVIEADNRIATAERFEAALQGDVQQISLMMKHKSGIPLDVQMTLTPYAAANGAKGVVLFSQDMSDRKRSSERIRYMAYYDDMTGLPNRRLYMMHVTEALSRPRTAERRVAVLYLDLDRFKLVNDSFGRDFGDMLLLQVAERLTRDLEEHDVAARMEGDEFAILYESVASDEAALERARKLLSLLEEPFELQGHPFHMSASIGIATNGDGAADPNVVVKKADIALGTVKDNGRNACLLYTGELDNSSLEKLTMQHEMRQALAHGEFILYYQPQYRIETGEVVGLEALVRWLHPERGMIPPGKFISIAEESGLIVQLGDWVLAEACRQNKEWQNLGLPPVPVSVNLSIRQFLQQNLTDKVASVLEETGLAPQYLDLEITESMTMDVQYASAQLIELSKLGVGISVDDFGTGYSSFHYLKNFPINRLKIDRSFVRDIQQDPNDAAIVAAIIAMAHNMNLQVIAEGVETEEQLFFLRKHRCDEMQGYYRSPPVPSPEIEGLLRTS